MAYPLTIPDLGRRIASGAYMADVATASSAFLPSPARGQIVEAGSVVFGTTNGAPAITLKVNGVAVSGMSWSIASGGGAGDVDSVKHSGVGPTLSVNEGDAIEFASDGAGSTVVAANFYVVIKRT